MSKLSELFRWKGKVELLSPLGKPLKREDGSGWVVFQKIIGDNDLTKARNESLKASRVLRAKLRDKDSDEYVANFIGIDALTNDEMVNAIVVSEIQDYRDEAVANVKEIQKPELFDNPSLEEQEKYQEDCERIDRENTDKLVKYIEKKGEERRIKLLEDGTDVIRKTYVDSIINIRCSEEFMAVFKDYCIYKGCYDDENYTTLAFDSFEDFRSSAPQLKNQLTIAYNKLELNIESLKN